jgi:hypothetical protein
MRVQPCLIIFPLPRRSKLSCVTNSFGG